MATFWTLPHASGLTGIAESEIIEAGKRGEFPFNNYTMLIMSPPEFMAWTGRRHIQDKADTLEAINERIVKLYVKMALLQQGLSRIEKVLKEYALFLSEKVT